MLRLLNCLRTLPPLQSRFPISSEMLADINWWLTFLHSFNGTALIQLHPSDLHRGGATCFNECITFAFLRHIENLALHITVLELFVLVIAVNLWAPKLAASSFKSRVTTTRRYRLRIQVAHRIPSCNDVSASSG